MATSSRPKKDRAVRAAKPKAPVKWAYPAKPAAAAASKQAPLPTAGRVALTARAPAAPAALAALAKPLEAPAPVAVAAANGEIGAPRSAPEPVPEHAYHPEPNLRRAATTAAAEARAAEPEPVPEAHEIPGRPLAAPDLTVMLGASRALVEGALLARSQMIAFTYRQAEQSLATGRAMLASGSLSEALALQAKYLGRALDDALTQTLELSRLSTDLVRAGLQSLRPH